MCIGIPMQIIASDGLIAQCKSIDRYCVIDLSLVGEQPDGTWLLTFLDTAREVLTEAAALQIIDALQALSLAMNGQAADIDALFADLTQREPQLPAHLR